MRLFLNHRMIPALLPCDAWSVRVASVMGIQDAFAFQHCSANCQFNSHSSHYSSDLTREAALLQPENDPGLSATGLCLHWRCAAKLRCFDARQVTQAEPASIQALDRRSSYALHRLLSGWDLYCLSCLCCALAGLCDMFVSCFYIYINSRQRLSTNLIRLPSRHRHPLHGSPEAQALHTIALTFSNRARNLV